MVGGRRNGRGNEGREEFEMRKTRAALRRVENSSSQEWATVAGSGNDSSSPDPKC